MKECKCKDWKENQPIIDSAVISTSLRGYGKGLKKSFKYCPWCGSQILNKGSKE